MPLARTRIVAWCLSELVVPEHMRERRPGHVPSRQIRGAVTSMHQPRMPVEPGGVAVARQSSRRGARGRSRVRPPTRQASQHAFGPFGPHLATGRSSILLGHLALERTGHTSFLQHVPRELGGGMAALSETASCLGAQICDRNST